MLPIAPSDAINAIPDTFCSAANLPATDQRGVARPQLDACDVGAVEVTLDEIPDHFLCANRYNGDLRVPCTPRCASTEVLIEVVGDFTQPVCVNRYNGDLRVPRSAGSCSSTEVARLI